MSVFLYIIRRVASALAVIAVIAMAMFLIFFMTPTNPAQLMCGKPCTPERLAQVSAFMGTDLPWYSQLFNYLQGIFVGRTFGDSASASAIVCAAPCLGWSFALNEPVTGLIFSRFPVTASIAIGAAVLWMLIGVFAGVLQAVKRDSWIDRLIVALSSIGISSPTYLIGLLAIIAFAVYIPVFPTGGYVSFFADPFDWAWHLLLAWIVLALINGAFYARITRSTMLREFGKDYVRTARAKGMPDSHVVVNHALRNAILPIFTMFGLDLGGLLGGAVITERVFSMHGLGSLLLDAVKTFDLQVLVGVTLFSAALVIIANLIVDVCYCLLDPRAAKVAL